METSLIEKVVGFNGRFKIGDGDSRIMLEVDSGLAASMHVDMVVSVYIPCEYQPVFQLVIDKEGVNPIVCQNSNLVDKVQLMTYFKVVAAFKDCFKLGRKPMIVLSTSLRRINKTDKVDIAPMLLPAGTIQLLSNLSKKVMILLDGNEQNVSTFPSNMDDGWSFFRKARPTKSFVISSLKF